MIYKHIAVAVDKSKTSLLALQHAISLAKAIDAKISIMTVVNPTEFIALIPEGLQTQNYETIADQQGQQILGRAVQIAKEEGLKCIHQELIISNQGPKDMAEKLVHKAESSGADLIVLGTHGRTGLMHLLMGSFAETVMRQSTLPLLVLRSQNNTKEENSGSTDS